MLTGFEGLKFGIRLYERVITEHINSWYSDLSQDEEFLQEMRILFRDTTTEVLTRLTRVRTVMFVMKLR